jgi:hypothetical protein
MFLQLPQELRDSIYYHLFVADIATNNDNPSSQERESKRLSTMNDRWQWNVEYAHHAPTAMYLDLMRTNRQLYHEVKKFRRDTQRFDQPSAHMTMIINYPNIIPTCTLTPSPPEQTTSLEILVKVDQLYQFVY